jgi:cytochrome P450
MTSPAGDVILGKFVPGNTYVSVAQWACYHSPSNFASPNDFIPERWLDDPRFAGDDRKAYQPFSVGPRNCIGQNLAWAEMRMILARLIWNFDLRLDKKSEDWLVGLKAWAVYEKSPLWVSLTPVKR